MAYTIATLVFAAQEADGRLHLEIRYTGDAGETPINKPFYVAQGTTPPAHLVRAEAMSQLAILNQGRTLVNTFLPQLPLLLDTTTALPSPPASTFGSYFAASLPFTPGATPQDVFTIQGSATKQVTINGSGIVTSQTTAGVNNWFLLARSTPNTGGTSAAVPAVRTLAGFNAATASVLQYTANPTAGTLVGRIWSGRVSSSAPATAGMGTANIDLSGLLQRNQLTLRSTDSLAWNFNGVALPAGLSVMAWVAWTEN